MNTVREMIVETQLQVQRLAGNRRDNLLDDKIIWKLNLAQEFLVQSQITADPRGGHRFLFNQKDNNEIQKLITPNYSLTVIKDTTVRGYCYLPSNFGYSLNERSYVLTDCSDGFETPTIEVVSTVYIIKFKDSGKTTPPYYTNIGIVLPTGTTTLTTSGFKSVEEKFELIEYIITESDRVGAGTWKTYYESYKNIYSPDSFIIVGVGIPSIDLTIDGDTCSKTSTTIIENNYKDIGTDEASNRSYKGDALYDAIDGNYYDSPIPESPITQLANNLLYVYTSKRFIVSRIFIDYIRKPRRISLSLNQTCELNSNVHRKVCSIAAEMLLGDIEASNYKDKVVENLTRT